MLVNLNVSAQTALSEAAHLYVFEIALMISGARGGLPSVGGLAEGPPQPTYGTSSLRMPTRARQPSRQVVSQEAAYAILAVG